MLTGPRRKWFLAALVLLAVGAALLILPTYSGYCDAASDQDQYGCAPYEITSSILSFLEAHNALISALATVFIGYFTYTLKKSTDNLFVATKASVDAANLNAQALIDGERAHLYVIVTQDTVSETIDAVSGAKYSRLEPSETMGSPVLAYVFKNSGKTPAILEEIMHGMTIQKTERHTIHYETPDRALEILAAGEHSEPIAIRFTERAFFARDAKALGSHDLMLFFYSAATFRDIFNRQHKIRHDFLYSAGRFHLINRIEKTYDGPKQDDGEKEQASRTGFFGRPDPV